MAHIRAPWELIWGSPGRTVRAPRIVDALGKPVVAFGNQMRWQGIAQILARAHLLTAAPELLAACESDGKSCGLVHSGPELLEQAAEYLEAVGMHGLVPSLRIKAQEERAAIAKARAEKVDR